MSDKFQGKYRIPSARLPGWDYGSNALYFVTICTQNREHYFGEITGGEMQLKPIGQSAYDCWHEIPIHFPFVVLEKFIVMPNHVHGIIRIDKPASGSESESVEAQNFAPLRNKFGPQSQNLASIVRGFKIGVTKYAKTNHIEFGWQSRFHDHIIRNEKSFYAISNYIEKNPQNWITDKFRN